MSGLNNDTVGLYSGSPGLTEGTLGLFSGAAGLQAGGGNPPPPPPPASVASPISGTDLTAVWNLKYNGTGSRSSSNGVWVTVAPGAGGTTTGIPAYLIGKGFVWSNHDEAIYLDVAGTSVTVEGYDFSLCKSVTINGTGAGTITFTDCIFPKDTTSATFFGIGLGAPYDINGNGVAVAFTVICNYCTFDNTLCQPGSVTGGWTFNYCKFERHVQGLLSNNSCSVTWNNCYIPGGGCNPPASAHVELTQFNGSSPAVVTVNNCMIDISAGGQATLGTTSPNYGWTGVFSGNAGTGSWVFTNSIIIGLTAVNANPSNPNRVNTCLWYKDLQPVSLTNCVLEAGVYGSGYTANGDSGAARPTDGGGNRSYANAALTSANFN